MVNNGEPGNSGLPAGAVVRTAVSGGAVLPHDLPDQFELNTESMDKFNVSSSSAALQAGLEEAIRFIQSVGVDVIEQRNLDLASVGVKGPASTWTYLVNDNPFRDQIGQMLTGPGRTSIAIFSAMWLMPLLITWGLVDRYLRRRSRRRADPYL